MELKGYITNLGKYNEGELVGKWITFPIDEDDELQTVLKEIGCCHYDDEGEYINTGYEEYFFTDWESDVPVDFGEYESIEFLNAAAEALGEWDEDIFAAACEIWGFSETINADPDDFILYEDVNNNSDLGYYWVEESGCYNLKDLGPLANYIDYEAFGRDVALETDGGFSAYGWVERR